jgi:hypothetical protein
MKTFSMSQYPNMETLLEARSMYYESLAYTLAEELHTLGILYVDENNDYRWSSTKQLLD